MRSAACATAAGARWPQDHWAGARAGDLGDIAALATRNESLGAVGNSRATPTKRNGTGWYW